MKNWIVHRAVRGVLDPGQGRGIDGGVSEAVHGAVDWAVYWDSPHPGLGRYLDSVVW